MKKFGKILLTLMIAAAMLLCSCADNTVTEPDVTTEADGTDAPELAPSKHEITVSDAKSILAENGLKTNINKWTTEACAYHGGLEADDGTITVNIAQNTNGDIIVTATSHTVLTVYIFDGKTDEMTKYETATVFSSDETPGYGQAMFDFENQKI